MPDPSILVTVPTVDEPAMAPEGRHVLYVLEPVPNLDGAVDWGSEAKHARDDLLAALGRFGYPTDVEVEELVDPRDWEAAGTGAGHPVRPVAPVPPDRAVPPAERRAARPGLFFAGASTVPGVGVPMVLVSGMLAAERVLGREAAP